LIGLHAGRISVHNSDGLDIIREHSKQSDSFIYADPPYFDKAGSLYLNSFTEEDHEALALCLNTRPDSRWILTYDNVPQVPDLYPDRRREVFSLNYSAHRVEKATEVMVFSDL
jgi:DNA adenine methylase